MYPLLKNIIDRITAATLLLLLMVPCLLAGLINGMLDRKPVFFAQKRIGKEGRIFTLYKLRTMKNNEITSLGKFLRRWSIDELPQLWNVAKGEMSLVGPRPLLVEYREFYSDQQNRRHEVLPGVTGLSQISGRNRLDWDRRFELDVFYVDHHSFLLDMKIILKTLVQLMDKRSADHHLSGLPKFSEQHS